MYRVECANCGKEFEAERSDAETCSNTCKVAWWRWRKSTEGELDKFKRRLFTLEEKAWTEKQTEFMQDRISEALKYWCQKRLI